MKCFGADQDVPGNTGATLPSPGAALGVPLGEAVATAAAGGAPGTAVGFPKAGGRTPEVNSDPCDRQAPVSSFHAEEHQELHVFQLGFVVLQQGEAGGIGT